jgi:hypothetical protein
MPDSGRPARRHPELASDDPLLTATRRTAELQEGKGLMNNQHAGLSQALAEQHITERREQAAHARLAGSARPPRRRHSSRAARGWWQLARWPTVATEQPVHRPHSAS